MLRPKIFVKNALMYIRAKDKEAGFREQIDDLLQQLNLADNYKVKIRITATIK